MNTLSLIWYLKFLCFPIPLSNCSCFFHTLSSTPSNLSQVSLPGRHIYILLRLSATHLQSISDHWQLHKSGYYLVWFLSSFWSTYNLVFVFCSSRCNDLSFAPVNSLVNLPPISATLSTSLCCLPNLMSLKYLLASFTITYATGFCAKLDWVAWFCSTTQTLVIFFTWI